MADKGKGQKKKGSVFKSIMSWVLTILLAFLAALLINTYLIRTSMIYGSSMYPTLAGGQVVALSKAPYFFSSPARGDVIVLDSTCFNPDYKDGNFFTDISISLKYNVISQKLFNINDNEERFWIKRVVGVPGDEIEFRGNEFYLNGVLQEEEYINKEISPQYDVESHNKYVNQKLTVEEGHVFVMGDNRGGSRDSRVMGQVPMSAILGKVITGV